MFLPFGTLVPGILLPLLAFAYMLFFGSYALNKTAGKFDADNHEVHTDGSTDEYAEAGSASFLLLTPDDHVASGLKQETNDPGIQRFNDRTIKIPDEEKVPDCHLFSHFTRPPPRLPEA